MKNNLHVCQEMQTNEQKHFALQWYKPLELVAADSLSEIVTELWRIVYV